MEVQIMCGFGLCKVCGDNSYECGPLGACGCFHDLAGIIDDVSDERKEEFIKKVKESKYWEFIKKHGFPYKQQEKEKE